MADSLPRAFGAYDVLALIERVGGTSTYRARQRKLDRLVTLTILPPQEACKVAFKKRFERQFAAASKLRHPNVVAAIDAGTIDGHQYIAAEYAGGRRLAQALEQGEWFPLRRCVAVALDIAQALEHLASYRIVHRGVTPQAILLAESGVAKLRGFSLSKEQVESPHETWFDLDAYGARYTAPEIAQVAERIDARADIYSLGCVLYEMLTGRPPFTGSYAPAVLMKHVNEDIPDPRALRGDIPDALAAVLARCLERDRTRRPPHAKALVAALAPTRVAHATPTEPARGPGLVGWLRSLPRRRG